MEDSGIYVPSKEDGGTNIETKSPIAQLDSPIEACTDCGEKHKNSNICTSTRNGPEYKSNETEMNSEKDRDYEEIKHLENHDTSSTVDDKKTEFEQESSKDVESTVTVDSDSASSNREKASSTVVPREHAALDYLLSQIPKRAQWGMLNHTDMILTCISANEDYISLGSNVGTVFLYNRKKQYMERFRHEVCCILPFFYLCLIQTIKLHGL